MNLKMMTQLSETDPLQLTLGPAIQPEKPQPTKTAAIKSYLRPDKKHHVVIDSNGRMSATALDLPPGPKAIKPIRKNPPLIRKINFSPSVTIVQQSNDDGNTWFNVNEIRHSKAAVKAALG